MISLPGIIDLTNLMNSRVFGLENDRDWVTVALEISYTMILIPKKTSFTCIKNIIYKTKTRAAAIKRKWEGHT